MTETYSGQVARASPYHVGILLRGYKWAELNRSTNKLQHGLQKNTANKQNGHPRLKENAIYFKVFLEGAQLGIFSFVQGKKL